MKGWECPKCGQCFAPHIDRCPDCVSAAVSVSVPTVFTSPSCTCPRWEPSDALGRCGACGKPRVTLSHHVVAGSESTVVMSGIGLGLWASNPTDSFPHHRYYVECIPVSGEFHGIIVDGRDEPDALRAAAWVIARLKGWVFVTFGTIRMVE